ncbi:phospho-sugar mutase [Peredibacter sp. HCB2-198]|uniref:phospho-sugar mutase n=1 Tax=Peredibacter sp. HCB2-198 TaxID=3383025 RepID=UPI0038B5AD8F
MDQKIIQNATLWGNNTYFSEADRQEILKLLADLPKNEVELTERFYRDLEFGTGGLRAPMGMGQNRMNRYNVRRATQALANNIIKHFNGGSAVISYDSRNCSKEFALEAAGVFAANGIKAYVFRALTPTPMLSYGVRYYKAQAGIMITASHNPPIYNGFKAFWNDGAQVVPPVDKEIINQYNELTDWNKIKYMPFEEAEKKGLAVWTDEKVENAFYEVIEKKVIQDLDLCKKHGGELSIVYTALHGSAEVPCNVTAKRLGFTNFYSIPEQAKPDGNFPTVKSPNPEDPKALAMAIDYMLKNNGDIVYGTDPDGDRLGVVVNDHGKPAILNGNQIAALMLYYVFFTKVEKKTLPEKALVIKSIVTSPIQNAIVEHFGGTVMDTLTGFKWMAGLIRDLEVQKSPYNFVFASEESFGYMPHNESRDKDGVSSMALMSEVALYYKRKNMSLVDALDEIYSKFGFFYESLVSLDYEGIEGAKKIGRIMEFFRHYPETQFAGEEIVGKEDYEASISSDIRLKSNKAIALPKSNVLSFSFASGNKLFLRPSGTEPKIKFYTMVRETEGDLAAKKLNALKKVKIIEDKIKEFCEKA